MDAMNDFVGTDGLVFVEFSGNKPHKLTDLFERMGFQHSGSIDAKSALLYTQGDILFISNPSCGGNAQKFRKVHGKGASAMGFRVENSALLIPRVRAIRTLI